MYDEQDMQKVKTERQFVMALVRVGVMITGLALLCSVAVTAFVVWDDAPSVRREAFIVATTLPLIIAPVACYFTSRVSYRNHMLMLEVSRLAHTDDMTGLANRRSFMKCAETKLETTQASRRGVAMFIVDIDHFKAVNDAYGHSAGDRSLTHVAEQMRDAVPMDSLIARLGGEEFAIMLSFESLDEIHDHAENLRQQVAASHCRVGKDKISVTISIGVGIAGPNDSVSTLMSRADCALYAAKDEGRNRFSIAA